MNVMGRLFSAIFPAVFIFYAAAPFLYTCEFRDGFARSGSSASYIPFVADLISRLGLGPEKGDGGAPRHQIFLKKKRAACSAAPEVKWPGAVSTIHYPGPGHVSCMSATEGASRASGGLGLCHSGLSPPRAL